MLNAELHSLLGCYVF